MCQRRPQNSHYTVEDRGGPGQPTRRRRAGLVLLLYNCGCRLLFDDSPQIRLPSGVCAPVFLRGLLFWLYLQDVQGVNSQSPLLQWTFSLACWDFVGSYLRA